MCYRGGILGTNSQIEKRHDGKWEVVPPHSDNVACLISAEQVGLEPLVIELGTKKDLERALLVEFL